MTWIFIPLTSAAAAAAWVYGLTESGAIFGFWPGISNKISTRNWWIKLSYGCPKCIAGQICLWRCIFAHDYDIWKVFVAIFAGLLIEETINKLRNGG